MKRFFKYPMLIVAIIGAITIFFALCMPLAKLDNNTFRFIPENDPARLAVQRIDEQYGSQINILVGFKRLYGTVLEKDFLLNLKDFSDKAAKLNRVDSVTSIMNIDYITGDAETIKVEDLVPKDFTASPAEISTIRERLQDWDLYKRAIISDDFTATQVLVAVSGKSDDAGNSDSVKLYDQLKELANNSAFANTEIYLTGMPAFTSVMNTAMRSDLVVLIPMVILVVLLVLFVSFRRAAGIILPMITVIISSIWAIGLMALLGVKLSMLATVLPVILVAVGSAYGIHVVSHYFDEIAGARIKSSDEHRTIIFAVIKRIISPVFLAALTTLAGFASLAITSVVPIQEFGIFATFGVLVAFVVSIALIPALLILRGPQRKLKAKNNDSEQQSGNDVESDAHLEADTVARGIATFFGSIIQRRRLVIALTGLVIVVGIFGASRLIIDNIIVNYFKSDAEVAKSDVFIRDQFAGSKTLSLIIKGKDKGAINDPEILAAMDDLSLYLESEVPEVGKVTGFHQLIKRINQVFNASEPASGIVSNSLLSTTTPSSETSEDDFGNWGEETELSSPEISNNIPIIEPVAFEKNQQKLEMVALISKALANTTISSKETRELIRNLEREVNYKGAAYYEVPRDPARYGKNSAEELKLLIGNYLLLLSGDVKSWANDALEPSETRMNIQLRTIGQADTMSAVAAIRTYVDARFPKDYDVEIVGVAMVEKALNEQVVNSQLSSIIASLVLVFLILMIYYRSVVAGLLGVFTLGLTILINFAVMGIAGIRLNIGTAMVASIAIGTGIDYIIHYLAAYHHESIVNPNSPRIMRRTLLTSGKAIIFNAVSVAFGFIILMFSQFNLLMYLGLLIAIAMGVSSLISLTVLPVLLDWFKPKFIQRPLYWGRNKKSA